jgi:hypothetical protein
VRHILVHGPRLGSSLYDGNALFGSIGEKGLTTRETGIEFGETPWSDDFDVGFKSIVG